MTYAHLTEDLDMQAQLWEIICHPKRVKEISSQCPACRASISIDSCSIRD
jgi:hypothetical protein